MTTEQLNLFGEPSKMIQVATSRRRAPAPRRLSRLDEVLTWSYGAGTQSIAIAVLIAQGKLPKPDVVVFCDTAYEVSISWRYTEHYVIPLLASVGVTIERASHDLAKVDLYRTNEETGEETLLLPAYTETGRFPTYCSTEWKKYVFRRYVRALGVKSCITWMGMSTDEPDRLKPSDKQWQVYHWPLCDLPANLYGIRMNRTECRQLVLNVIGVPPPKSRCFICSHQSNVEWREMKENDPQDFAKAIAYDEMIRQRDKLHAVYLHKSAKPLVEVDFSQPDEPTLFGEENGGCQSGYCFI